jgi:cell division protein ZapA (FtsZ GTPase activity inhibitor)
MSEKERLVNCTLLGQNYSFYTGASDDEIKKIFNLVEKLMATSTAKTSSGTIPTSKTAIMACLNIASRYIKLQQDFEDYRKKNDAKVSSLIDKIEASLLTEKTDKNV